MSTGVPAAVYAYLLSQLLSQHVMTAAVSACQADADLAAAALRLGLLLRLLFGWLYFVC